MRPDSKGQSLVSKSKVLATQTNILNDGVLCKGGPSPVHLSKPSLVDKLSDCF